MHKTLAVQQALTNYGVQPRLLATILPEDNPIELAWSQDQRDATKNRTTHALSVARRCGATVVQAITSANRSDRNNWITHCGYTLNP